MAITYLLAGILAFGLLVLAGRIYVNASPRDIIRLLRILVGSVLIVIGGVFMIGQRWGIGTAALALGFSALVTGRLGPLDLGGGARSPGSASTVRTSYFEMRLDHDTGDMDGTVLAGAFAGQTLGELSEGDLIALFNELIDGEQESAALLAAYLDRRKPGWREDFEGDPAAGTGGAPDAGPMTDEQAYEILGLSPGASAGDVRAAHRRLMKRVHPDQGGSTFLAAKINEAKDRLLSRHR